MKMRQFLCFIATIATTGALIVSCNSGTVTGLGVSDLKIGTSAKDKSSHLGAPIPVSGVAFAEHNIASLEVSLKDKSGAETFAQQDLTNGASGETKTNFAAHIELPTDVEAGEYLVTLTIKDQQGNEETEESPITLLIDSSFPAIADLDVGLNAAGNDLHLESNVAAANKLDKIIVFIEGESWNKEVEFAKPSIAGKLTLHFHEHVHVDEAPAGDYTITLTIIDQEGNEASTQANFTKKQR